MDTEKARFNMVEQQIRPWDVLDQDVLDLLFKVKREDFVPPAYRSLAFVDMEIPIGESQPMWAPKMEARVLQELAPKPHERVLEIGTGSGYMAVLLAKCAASVTSIEYHAALSTQAAAYLAAAEIGNVMLKVGDAANGIGNIPGADEKFDVIVITGSVPVLPPAYLNLLNTGGRLFAVVGDAPVMMATIYKQVSAGSYTSAVLFETVVEPLINAVQPERFTF